MGISHGGDAHLGPQYGVRTAGGGGLTFLLRDDFTTTESAPIASPRTAEPGPGTWTAAQTTGQLSIAAGRLVVPGGGGVSHGDPGLYSGSFARATGRALVGNVLLGQTNVMGPLVGWNKNANANLTGGPIAIYFRDDGTIRGYGDETGTLISTWLSAYSATTYQFATILRAVGGFALLKGGALSEWTLLWVGNSGTTTPVYAAAAGFNTGSTSSFDNMRVLDLPTPFNDDYGLATQRLAGAQSAGQTFTHEADCIIEFVLTMRPSASDNVIKFRYQDANNHWSLQINSGGGIQLYEVVAGVFTSRGSAGGVLNGNRIVVIASGTKIQVYSANVLLFTYSGASNFSTETDGVLSFLGSGGDGVISDIVTWPRTLSGAAATLLDQAVA